MERQRKPPKERTIGGHTCRLHRHGEALPEEVDIRSQTPAEARRRGLARRRVYQVDVGEPISEEAWIRAYGRPPSPRRY